MAESKLAWDKEDRIRATIYGNCIGDAIGLATEFMTKEDVKETYKKVKHFEYSDIGDRLGFKKGDWTDDSDQMILIMMSFLENDGESVPTDFAAKMFDWYQHGYPELGDLNCVDIGISTTRVVMKKDFLTEPHKAAEQVWEESGRKNAANGGVMRTSIVGTHMYWDIKKVIENTLDMCAVTHADPRCKACCVAVSTSIAFMLQGQERHFKDSKFDTEAIMNDSFEIAKKQMTDEAQIAEFRDHMFAPDLEQLKLDSGGIGYTFKTMGAGFWAFRQEDFRTAIEAITRAAGDADTNGAVAGALLGCKLGTCGFPKSWLKKLRHKDWLDKKLDKFVSMVKSKAPK